MKEDGRLVVDNTVQPLEKRGKECLAGCLFCEDQTHLTQAVSFEVPM